MDKLTVRIADLSDMPQLMGVYENAREFMRRTGNPTQWGDSFPPAELLEEHIQAGHLYAVVNEEGIQGAFAFIMGEDANYSLIENGSWLSDEEYGTIHRVASNGSVKGVFDVIMDFCEKQTNHLRIDTHENNKVMRRLIEKHDFSMRGIIYAYDGSPRIAYEKLLS